MSQNLGDGLNRTVTDVKAKVARMQEALKLKGKISELQRQKLNHLIQMGSLAYRAFRADEPLVDRTFKEAAEAILGLDVQLTALFRELAAVEGKDLVSCPQCGNKSDTAVQFCPSCGANIVELRGSQQTCQTCRTPMAANSRFCGCCGSLVRGN